MSWAHPKFENVIATCGYDRMIKVWKETKINQWDLAYQVEAAASVNSVQWASWEYGLVLAAGCADGKVHILSRDDYDNWTHRTFAAHDGGINGLSWGPATQPTMLLAEKNDIMNPDVNEKAL
jgi:protein transport protein SEC13